MSTFKFKRIALIGIMFLLTCSTCFAAEPSTMDISGVTYFFANGNEITIKERTDENEGALITWGENGEILVDSTANIFGGAHDDETEMSTHIIMEGGTVNAIFGGGLHKSNVTEALVEIKEGTINFQVCGGGVAALTTKCGCTWYNGNAEESNCRVVKSNVEIEEGATFSGKTTNGYSLLYGGGQGISYTKEATITIKGGIFFDTYVTVGGSNGYTEIGILNIQSGNFANVVQGINRGSMKEIKMNISGGTFNNLYIGGETADASVTGSYEKANVVIEGENIKITNLLPGSNGNSVEDDTSKLRISLGKNVLPENITSKEIAESILGANGEYKAYDVISLTLNKENVIMYKGDGYNLIATLETGEGVEDKSLIWESTNPEVATVENGNIKGLKTGETTIIVKAKADETIEARCNVRVFGRSSPTENLWNNPFYDVEKGTWYYNSIRYVNKKGLFKGVKENKFDVKGGMTRGMIVEVLYRLSEEKIEKKTSYEDVNQNAYYSEAIAWAKENEIVEGIGDNKFAPDREVTREEIVMILCRYAEYKEENTEVETNLSKYEDKEEISEKAVAAFKWATKNEIIKGVSENSLAPKKTATRAEVAVIIERYCKK